MIFTTHGLPRGLAVKSGFPEETLSPWLLQATLRYTGAKRRSSSSRPAIRESHSSRRPGHAGDHGSRCDDRRSDAATAPNGPISATPSSTPRCAARRASAMPSTSRSKLVRKRELQRGVRALESADRRRTKYRPAPDCRRAGAGASASSCAARRQGDKRPVARGGRLAGLSSPTVRPVIPGSLRSRR